MRRDVAPTDLLRLSKEASLNLNDQRAPVALRRSSGMYLNLQHDLAHDLGHFRLSTLRQFAEVGRFQKTTK